MKKVLFLLCCLISVHGFGQISKIKHDADSLRQIRADELRVSDSIEYAKEQKENDKNDRANKAYQVRMEKKYGKAAINKVNEGEVWVGITDELCLYGLTEPNRKQTTYTKGGKTELWVYHGRAGGCIGNGCPYLDFAITFKDHKAIAITTNDNPTN